MSGSLSSFESKSLRFSKEVNSLESQLNDAKVAVKHTLRDVGVRRAPLTLSSALSQESLQDETRQKMTLATRVRTLEEEKNGLMERLEEEEERSKELTRQIQTLSQQVSRPHPHRHPHPSGPASQPAHGCVPLAAVRAPQAVRGGQQRRGERRGDAQETPARAGRRRGKGAAEGGGEGESGAAAGAAEGGDRGHDARPAEGAAELHSPGEAAEEVRPGLDLPAPPTRREGQNLFAATESFHPLLRPQCLAEEKAVSTRLAEERDKAEADSREKETKYLALSRALQVKSTFIASSAPVG